MVMKIQDADLNRTITLADAYRVMFRFLEQHHARGETNTGFLLGGLSLSVWSDGSSADPAWLQDFVGAANEVLGPPSSDAAA